MNEKVDLTKILKDCPEGFKLYSPLFGEVVFEGISDSEVFPITTTNSRNIPCAFTKEGLYNDAYTDAECLLFPSKDQRDWYKFTAPWYKKPEPKFKVGDWLCANELNDYANLIKIVKIVDVFGKKRYKISIDYDSDLDLTEFDFIDKHYHLWTIQDAKDGDVLVHSSFMFDDFIFIYNNTSILQAYCYYSNERNRFIIEDSGHHCPWNMQEVTPATKEQRDLLFRKIKEAGYKWNAETKTLEKLVEPKFDPKTLQPFDRVLVKDGYSQCWRCNLFSHTETEYPMFPYTTHVGHFYYCIPYNEDTKHLVGTTEEVPEYYKYWED